MSIRTTCQACGHVFRVKDEFAGVKAKCSSCGAVLQIPQAPAASAQKPPVAAPLPKPSPGKTKPAPAAPQRAAAPAPRPSARTAAPAVANAAPQIQVGDEAASVSSRTARHSRPGRGSGRNPNTNLMIVAAAMGALLLGIVGVGGLYLAGVFGDGEDVAQGGGAPETNTEGQAAPTDQGGASTGVDASTTRVDASTTSLEPRDDRIEPSGIDAFPGMVQRISPDSFQTETTSGAVGVKISSAKLGRLPDSPNPNKQYLLVTLQVENKGPQQVRYATWDGQALLNMPVVLMDDSGRLYRQTPMARSDDGSWDIVDSPGGSGGKPLHVSDSDFDAQVLQSEQPVLVDFYADWCGPCRALAPTIDRLAGATAGKAKIVKVNIDQSRQVAKRYGIRAIPHLILFHEGEIAAQNPGRSFDALLGAINRVAPGAGEPVGGGETLEPHSTVEQILVFEPSRDQAEFLRLELPADAVGGQGVLTLEIPWSMIAAGTDDRVARLAD